ncbi:MAG: right-handed parallel beta-helix repeat-containing protein [Candidatus Bathyarchaeota archaeon]|nr:right-handed parallel beta-helix repeat-containing protein [Candidatus Bathyarchaeota archaeon]
MKKKILALIIVAVLVSSVSLQFVEINDADPYIAPEEAPAGFRIQKDGACDIPGVERQGVVYTLTCDIFDTVVIERDGITLEGNGHTIRGNGGSIGVWLQDKSNVTIQNLNIVNFTHGIRFSHYAPYWRSGQNPNFTISCSVESCNITGNDYGISLYFASNCSVLGNYIANSTYGVDLSGSNNVFRLNRIEENKYNFVESAEYINDVDSSNKINSKPVYYWINQHNQIVPDDAGMVVLKNCSEIRVQNLSFSNSRCGISLYNTNNSVLIGNKLAQNYKGLELWRSHNNSIIYNHITNATFDGIEIYHSENTTIAHNLIANNENGIYHRAEAKNEVISDNLIINNKHSGILGGSDYSKITHNFVVDNGGGITVGSACQVTRNNITRNSASGIIFRSNNLITDNYISKNQIGLMTNNGQGNIITQNSIIENDDWGSRFQGETENNLIYYNNFILNNGSELQASIKGYWVFDLSTISEEDHPPPQHVAGAYNSWDNGTVGNYWSNYHLLYPYAQAVENQSFSNEPYVIDDNNKDNYPLLRPIKFNTIEMPSTDAPPEMYISPVKPIEEQHEPIEPSPTTPVTGTIVLSILGAAGLVVVFLVYFRHRRKVK